MYTNYVTRRRFSLAWSFRFSGVGEATPTKRAIKAQPALEEGKGYALKRVKLPLRDAEIEMISKSHWILSLARTSEGLFPTNTQ